ncbi:MAG: hypothetical protein PF487_11690 [Bacteroidales bacterium]|nr:hypothetical protein [Bacteroidales bacterium]
MENLDKYSPIQLQKMGNDIKEQHDKLKLEIVDNTYELEKLENQINEKIIILEELENKYVVIIEKLTE